MTRSSSVQHESGNIIVNARTSKNRNQANISMVFSEPELELRQWTVIDDQGLQTTVALRSLEQGVEIPPWLFVLSDMKRPVGVKPRD